MVEAETGESKRGGRPTGARSQRSREAILKAAVRVVGSRGVAGASLSNIAKEAGTSKAALLYHFESSENLLRAMAGLALAHFQEVVFQAAHAAESRENKVQIALDALFQPDHREVLWAVREVAGLGIRDPGIGTEVIQVFDHLARNVAELFSDVTDGRFETARAIVITVFGHLEMWLCSSGEPDPYVDSAGLAVRAIAAANPPVAH